jgi:hypothetical protein
MLLLSVHFKMGRAILIDGDGGDVLCDAVDQNAKRMAESHLSTLQYVKDAVSTWETSSDELYQMIQDQRRVLRV